MGVLGVKVTVLINVVIMIFLYGQQTNAAISKETQTLINNANANGPYLGLVIPNLFEMNPLLVSGNYTSSGLTIDFSGN